MSPTSTPNLKTYEGRRAMWAAEMLSGKFVPYVGGGLRGPNNAPLDDRPLCCCLGVAQELILTVAPRILQRGDAPGLAGRRSETYASIQEPEDATSGWLTGAAAAWYGLPTAPQAAVDEQFIDEFDTLNRERGEARNLPIYLHQVNGQTASACYRSDFKVGDQVGLASLNDAGVPWEIIAGLITRERLICAKTGPVEE